MKTDPNEAKLRQYFQEQRRRDAAGIPDFERLAQVPSCRPHPIIGWRVLAAAALLALGLGIAFFHIRARQPTDYLRQWTAFSNWQASTDPLLSMSGASLESALSTTTDTFFENNWQQTVLNQHNRKETL
jgi:hypothetical protein